MALLKGFPPSNVISPTTWILDDDDPNKKSYLHTNNFWFKKRENEKWDRISLKEMFSRTPGLGDAFPFKILGERLMDQMVALGHRAREKFEYTVTTSAPWFVWYEYHVVHALSKALGWDVRLSWMNSWKWQETDPWCQARMQEKLSDPTPLALAEKTCPAKRRETPRVIRDVKVTHMGCRNCIVRKEIPDL